MVAVDVEHGNGIERAMGNARLILFHREVTSDRVRFLRLRYGGVCAFEAIPESADLVPSARRGGSGAKVIPHPLALTAAAEKRLSVLPGSLIIDGDFLERVAVPNGIIRVHLARFTAIDPPFAAVAHCGARFINFSEIRNLPSIDRRLIQRAFANAFA